MKAMKNTLNRPSLLLLIMVAGALAYQSLALRPGPVTEPAVIASVNLELVFGSLDLRGAANAELEKLATSLDDELTRQKELLDVKEEDLAFMTPGSDAYRQTEVEMLEMSGRLAAYVEFADKKMNIERSRVLREIYDEIKATIAALCDEEGYDVVFVDDSIVELPEVATEAEMMRQISARRMLHTRSRIDISQDVIQRMNQSSGG